MQLIRCLILVVAAIASSCNAQEKTPCDRMMEYVENRLSHEGVLKNRRGFVYVDIDDEYIHKLISFIREDGFEEPPYFGTDDLVGAHITVIDSEESKQFEMGEIYECGETIYFTPTTCAVACPLKWKGIDEVYVIVVDAPELDRIREKYGLPKRKYAFHITVGVKPKVDIHDVIALKRGCSSKTE